MVAGTPVAMNPDGQFFILNPGDTLNIVATVANTGSYNDLSNQPAIPAAQVESDWNAITGLGVILNKPTIPSVAINTSPLTLSLVGTGATGTQISTKNANIKCNVSTSTTANITTGAASTSFVALKICSTNNATEASWTTVGILESDQTIGLAIALNSVQTVKGQLVSDVPASWFAKLVNSGTGTHTETFISAQQTIYG